MTENGGENPRIEGIRRFLGLSGTQQRGKRPPASQPAPQPSPDELRNMSIATMLRADPAGSRILLTLIEERMADANLSANVNVQSHPLCAGFLGAEAALKRLHDDLTNLSGQSPRRPA
jgi:hypothetical protein